METYKTVDDSRFPNCYQISNKGNVKTLRKNKITKGSLNVYGYKYITGNYNGVRATLLVHRLVAKAFIPNPSDLPCINHIDGDKTNNNVENLEWCTHSKNMIHAVKTGLHTNCTQKGENHNTSKHSFEKVTEIRNRYKNEKISMRQLAKEYNTTSGYISDVINNKIRIYE